MSIRQSWLKAAFTLLACPSVISGLTADRGHAQEGFGNNSVDSIHLTKLEDQLRYGLRCSRSGQVQYVSAVAAAVDEGRLPRGMVNLVYRWAIEKNPSVPFPYFQYALEALAARRGIQIHQVF